MDAEGWITLGLVAGAVIGLASRGRVAREREEHGSFGSKIWHKLAIGFIALTVVLVLWAVLTDPGV